MRAWTDIVKKKAEALAKGSLSGVGEERLFWKRGEIALHLRKRLTYSEINRLDKNWLLLPALDEAG